MRVIKTDNYGGDYPVESFVSDSLSLFEAEKLARSLNLETDPTGPDYFIVVADIYELKKGFKP